MRVQFYNFKKRNNSTARPAGTAALVLDGSIKSPSDITNPVIQFNMPIQNFLEYAYIPDFGRYYHVDKWRYVSGLWECEMVCDVLASFKDDILDSTAFVLYSSNVYNTELIDSRLSNSANPKIASAGGNIFTELNMSNYGCYALNVISSEGGFGTATYILGASQLKTLIELLCIDSPAELNTQMDQLFAGASINSIISCTWFPWLHESSANTVVLAGYDTGVQAEKIDFCETYTSTTINIPWPYNDWRRSPAFISASLFLPFYGLLTIPVDKIQYQDTLKVTCSIDYSTGGGTYVVTAGDLGFITCASFNIGCNVPVSGLSVDPYGAIKSGVQGVGSGFSLNFGSTAEAAFETIEALTMPQSSVSGGYGQSRSNGSVYNTINLGTVVQLYLIYNEFSDDPEDLSANIGRPLKSVANLSTLNGYCQCANYSANCGLESETNEINRLMNGGVYIE